MPRLIAAARRKPSTVLARPKSTVAGGSRSSGLPIATWSALAATPSESAWQSQAVAASDVQTKTFAPLRSVLPGFIAEGATLLARPKLGKSWLALDHLQWRIHVVWCADAIRARSGKRCKNVSLEQQAFETPSESPDSDFLHRPGQV
jgi:hypothetical protein